MSDNVPLFRDLNADDADPEATVVESMCVNCGGNGQTRLLLTKIPFFKEVVLMSFSCDQCGFENNEITSGSVIPEKAVKITLKVNDKADLKRQLVKSDHTRVEIPELQFEIPSKSQKGEITTVEGVIDRIIRGLQQDQPQRREEHPEVAEKIDGFIKTLEELKDFERPFTLILDDISGNSFIENPIAPKTDPNCTYEYYRRNKEQDHELGIFTQEEVTGEKSILHPIKEGEYSLEEIQGEVLQFPTNCPSCGSPCETNMKMTNIPHFKEVIIMATVCDVCGIRTNEVKSGAGIEPKGVKIEVLVKTKEDLTRDVLKSETCELAIPELDLTVGPHALGGRFTTVEGLIVAIKEQLSDPSTAHIFGDSEAPETKEGFSKFLSQLDEVLENKSCVTLVLDDPCGNSYIQSMRDDDQPDERLKITHYERTFEQNEELGLNDMKTEGYEEH
ncbi:zinc finger protein ZPR1 [Anthonomus grandis grandis]|uniref:zinc finger protein ZPR1 n=1 Tax=Anthonomus grandis grandis TaxID=2921223 RepID=UPI0021667701|nr:zinc finger protein ZPR1 [Anthonomus grandis grandis]